MPNISKIWGTKTSKYHRDFRHVTFIGNMSGTNQSRYEQSENGIINYDPSHVWWKIR